ncbi:Uncharacterised protein [Klebsiella quasivariicola]|nr:Uncharacterised protein [Klebsiella quasivariicola]
MQIAIILETNLHIEIGATGLSHLLLFSGDSYTHDADLVVSCHIFGKTTPSTADIQYPHTRFKLKLAANQIQFVLLRGLKGLRLFPVTAGILHVRVKHPTKQIVTEIVMLFAHNPGAFFTL